MKRGALLLTLFLAFGACEFKSNKDEKTTSSGGSGSAGSGNASVSEGSYKLDASPTEMSVFTSVFDPSFQFEPLTMSLLDTRGSYTLKGDGVKRTAITSAAGFPNSSPQTIDFSSGKKAFECESTIPEADDASGSGSSMFQTFCLAVDPTTVAPHVYASIIGDDQGKFRFEVMSASSGLFYELNNLTREQLPSRVGFEFNSDTEEISVYLDNVKLGGSISYSPYPASLVIQVLEQSTNLGFNQGKVVSVRAISAAEDMTTQFSSGTTDFLGNPINN